MKTTHLITRGRLGGGTLQVTVGRIIAGGGAVIILGTMILVNLAIDNLSRRLNVDSRKSSLNIDNIERGLIRHV